MTAPVVLNLTEDEATALYDQLETGLDGWDQGEHYDLLTSVEVKLGSQLFEGYTTQHSRGAHD